MVLFCQILVLDVTFRFTPPSTYTMLQEAPAEDYITFIFGRPVFVISVSS